MEMKDKIDLWSTARAYMLVLAGFATRERTFYAATKLLRLVTDEDDRI